MHRYAPCYVAMPASGEKRKPVLIDPSLFEVARVLEENWQTFARELASVEAAEFHDCPHTTLYNHGWEVYPIVMDYYPFPCDFEKHRRDCPDSYALLSRFPQIACGAFSRLRPGCHIIPHTDNPPPGQLRAHLALTGNAGVRMRIQDEYVEWEPGRILVFDTQMEHEVVHAGDDDRDIVLADFKMSETEQRALDAWYDGIRHEPSEIRQSDQGG